MTIFDPRRASLRAEQPAALATVIAGPGVGNTRLVRPGEEPIGTLGDPRLDRVAGRDALAELEAGRTGVRHYGSAGEANPDEAGVVPVHVFIESYAPLARGMAAALPYVDEFVEGHSVAALERVVEVISR